ncbi:MAG: glycosyltransferase family 2 protein [Candidatus Gastranaerophilales bacterium]|nr:glycosyltransferase family 2 protein [Candidatus Gastranaerophilales bacterium]
MPKISVIIPVYNVEKYLRECLDSVVGQTLEDIEIICINDGSSDDSLKILEEYVAKDNRIKVLSQHNKGAGEARNAGINAARGEYLAFIDGDDFYHTDFCKKMHNKALLTNSDVVVCAARSYNIKKKKYNKMPWSLVEEYLPQKDVFNYKDMNKYIFIFSQNWNWNKIFKKEFIDKNHISFQSLYRTNDLFFTCKALICADKISVVNEELVVYRTGMKTNSQSTNHLHPLDFYEAFKTLREYLISIDKFEDVEQCYINWALKGLINNVISVKDKTVKYKMGNFLYNSGLEYLGLCSVDFRDIYLQSDYEEFIDQFYKYRKKMFGYEKSKNHYFIYLFGLRLVVKRRFLCQK